MIKWKKLREKIPASVKIGTKTFEIVWVTSFYKDNPKDEIHTLGETRFNEKQIVLKSGRSDKETVKTYLHEVTHAVSFEENINLTENQVIRIEKSLIYLLKPNNVFLEK